MKKISMVMMAASLLVAAPLFAQEAEVVAEPVAEAAVTAEGTTEAVAQEVPAVTNEIPGLQTMFSQVFVDASFKEISIELLAEDFTLVTSGSDAITLEIKSNTKEFVPTVVQDGKSLKVTQKNKKSKTPSRVCSVVLTLPQNYPPAKFNLSLTDGKATLDTFAAGEVELSAGNGTITAKEVRADGEFELSVDAGKATLDTVVTKEAELSAGTGLVTVQGVRADKKLSVSAGNGTVNVQQTETKSLSASAKKGTLTLKNVSTDEFAISADKGSAVVDLAKSFTKASSLNVSTGSINLLVPATAVLYDTVSVGKGHYKSEFPSDTTGPELKGKIGKGNVTETKK